MHIDFFPYAYIIYLTKFIPLTYGRVIYISFEHLKALTMRQPRILFCNTTDTLTVFNGAFSRNVFIIFVFFIPFHKVLMANDREKGILFDNRAPTI